jgi:hypothetical protein
VFDSYDEFELWLQSYIDPNEAFMKRIKKGQLEYNDDEMKDFQSDVNTTRIRLYLFPITNPNDAIYDVNDYEQRYYELYSANSKSIKILVNIRECKELFQKLKNQIPPGTNQITETETVSSLINKLTDLSMKLLDPLQRDYFPPNKPWEWTPSTISQYYGLSDIYSYSKALSVKQQIRQHEDEQRMQELVNVERVQNNMGDLIHEANFWFKKTRSGGVVKTLPPIDGYQANYFKYYNIILSKIQTLIIDIHLWKTDEQMDGKLLLKWFKQFEELIDLVLSNFARPPDDESRAGKKRLDFLNNNNNDNGNDNDNDIDNDDDDDEELDSESDDMDYETESEQMLELLLKTKPFLIDLIAPVSKPFLYPFEEKRIHAKKRHQSYEPYVDAYPINTEKIDSLDGSEFIYPTSIQIGLQFIGLMYMYHQVDQLSIARWLFDLQYEIYDYTIRNNLEIRETMKLLKNGSEATEEEEDDDEEEDDEKSDKDDDEEEEQNDDSETEEEEEVEEPRSFAMRDVIVISDSDTEVGTVAARIDASDTDTTTEDESDDDDDDDEISDLDPDMFNDAPRTPPNQPIRNIRTLPPRQPLHHPYANIARMSNARRRLNFDSFQGDSKGKIDAKQQLSHEKGIDLLNILFNKTSIV